MRKIRAFGVNTNMLATLCNAAICTLIMFGSVRWGGVGIFKKIGKVGRNVCKKNNQKRVRLCEGL